MPCRRSWVRIPSAAYGITGRIAPKEKSTNDVPAATAAEATELLGVDAELLPRECVERSRAVGDLPLCERPALGWVLTLGEPLVKRQAP